jgi:hypothetical protein
VKQDGFVWLDPSPKANGKRVQESALHVLRARVAELEARLALLEMRPRDLTRTEPVWVGRVVELCERAHARYTSWRPRSGWKSRLADLAEHLALRALRA